MQPDGKLIYLDYQSTTHLDPRVEAAMTPYGQQYFGNSHSVNHAFGWMADEAVKEARTQIAACVGAKSAEIIFTSGATEANNLAIQGLAKSYAGKKNHIITLQTEHSCVLGACKALEDQGFEVTYLPVKSDGLVDLDVLAAAITEQTFLISIMMVNNEIGVIQPIAEIGKLAAEKSIFFHCDGAQAVGKIPVDVMAMGIHLLSLSGHKMYGPKGIGALYVRESSPRVPLQPLFYGGGQEKGLRAGTLPTALCVGLGKACVISQQDQSTETQRITDLSQLFWTLFEGTVPNAKINGSITKRWVGNLNIQVPGVTADSLLPKLGTVAISAGSACSTGSDGSSHVLQALGLTDIQALSSFRIGFGRTTTEQDVRSAVFALVKAVESSQISRKAG